MQAPRPTSKPRGGPWPFIVGTAVVVSLVLVALWWFGRERPADDPAATAGVPVAVAETATGSDTPSRESHWESLLGHPPLWPDDFDEPSACEEIELELMRLCREIDRRPYRADDRRAAGTCGLIEEVAEALASSPPRPEGEIRSHARMLANVFRLARAVDDPTLEAARRAFREEEYLVEPMAMTLWRWAASRERCERHGGTAITEEALYANAAYLLETFGGRSLLQRRSPRTEALVLFYALTIVDRADARGINPHGVDPTGWIPRARALIEGGGFTFADEYLRRLDAMAARWNARVPDASAGGAQ